MTRSLRLPLLSRSLLTTLPAALALLGLVLLLAVTGQLPTSPSPVQAQTQSSTVLLSTVAGIRSFNNTTGFAYGQGFLTGNTPSTLTSISLQAANLGSGSQQSTIRGELWDSSLPNYRPGTKLADLTFSSAQSSGTTAVFTAPDSTTLQPNTVYNFLVYTTTNFNLRPYFTPWQGGYVERVPYWEIRSPAFWTNTNVPTGSSSWTNHTTGVALIQVNGSLLTGGAGMLDSSFGDFGQASLDLRNVFEDFEGRAMALDADGKMVVAGNGWSGGNQDFAVVRYNADGSLDTDFGTEGRVTTAVGSGHDEAQAVAVDGDGNIVVAGYSDSGSNHDFAVVRYDSDGNLDTDFSTDGKVTTGIGSAGDFGRAVVVQSDGKIVVAGYSWTGSNRDFAVVRYNANGSLDTGFHADGKVTTAVGSGDDEAHALALDGDGNIVVAGNSHNGSNHDFAAVRYDSDGSLDTDFSTDGKVTTGVGSAGDFGRAVAVDGDGNIVVAGNSYNGSNHDFAVVRYDSDGSLDTDFDSDGKVTTGVGSGHDYGHAVAVDGDGKIVVAGTRYASGTPGFALVRYKADGSLDDTFGTIVSGNTRSGKQTTSFGSGNSEAHTVALASNGKIVAAGFARTSVEVVPALARYNANGTLDTSFDSDGKVAPFDSHDDQSRAVALQADGKVVTAGSSHNGSDDDFAVARYNADGTLDADFGEDGRVTTEVGSAGDFGRAVAVDGNGKIVVAGNSWVGSNHAFAVVRYNADGTLDTGFSTDGKVTTSIGSGHDYGHGVAVDGNGKIVVAGYGQVSGGWDVVVVRYNANGTLDSGFGTSGKVTTAIGTQGDRGLALAVQSDGKIVVAGYSYNGSDQDFAVVRYNANGTLDSGFGTGGKVTTAVGSGDDEAQAVAMASDGKIVVAGYSDNGSNQDFAVVRYDSDGSLDTGFHSDGKVTTEIGSAGDFGRAVVVQPDGKIVVAGNSYNGSNHDFVLLRYNADGSLDTGFGHDADADENPDGYSSIRFGPGDDIAQALALQPDGNIVVGGYGTKGGKQDFALARFLGQQADPTNLSALTAESSADGATFTDLTLSPAFSVATTTYTAIVAEEVTHARLTPTLVDSGSSVKVGRSGSLATVSDGTASSAIALDIGDNEIIVEVTASDGATKEYTVNVQRRDVWSATLTPAEFTIAGPLTGIGCHGDVNTALCDSQLTDDEFDVGGQTYSFTIVADWNNDVFQVGLDQAAGTALQELKFCVDGADYSIAGGQYAVNLSSTDVGWTAGTSVDLSIGTSCPVSPTNANPTNANLSNLTVADGNDIDLAPLPAFSTATTSYRATVSSSTTHVKLTPTAENGSATVQVGKSGSLAAVDSGSASDAIPLEVGDNTIIVRVTATDGMTSQDYTLTIWRAPLGSIWSATLDVKDLGSDTFGCDSSNATEELKCSTALTLTGNDFSLDSQAYEVTQVRDRLVSGAHSFHVFLSASTNAALRGLNFCIGDTAYPLSSAGGGGQGADLLWQATDVGWAAGEVVSLSIGASCTEEAPTPTDDGEIWSATLTVVQGANILDSSMTITGCSVFLSNGACDAQLDDYQFEHRGTDYDVNFLSYDSSSGNLVLSLNHVIPSVGITEWVLRLDDNEFRQSRGVPTSDGLGINWPNHGLSWSAGDTVEASLAFEPTALGPGSLDPEFSAASVVTTAIGSGEDRANAVATQSDGKVVVAGYNYNGTNDDFAVVRYTADGVPDPTFGTGGIATTTIGAAATARANAVTIQSDGKIVVAGYSYNGTNNDFAVVRYTTDGDLDTTFSADGKVTTAVGSGNDIAHSVAIQTDGKVVVAGSGSNGTDLDFVVARYTAAGVLDTDFGSSTPGYVTTAVGGGDDTARAVAIQSDGKIVAVGDTTSDWAVVRYNADGTLDTSFDSDGKVVLDMGGSAEGLYGVAIQSDGKIVAAGYDGSDFAVARFNNTDGSLDTTFGTDGTDADTDPDGYATTGIGSAIDAAWAMDIQSDGKIVLAGISDDGSLTYDFALARYNVNGTLDTSFSGDGKVTTAIGSGTAQLRGVAVRSDGTILAAGYGSNGSNDDFALAAYDADGEPAAVLDGPGWLSTAFGSGTDRSNAVAVDGDGNIVVAGYSNNGSDDDFAVARYNADGTLDTDFDSDGIATTTIGSLDDQSNAVAIQSDGKIVAAGYSYNGGEDDFAVTRYNTDGTLDTGFGTTTTGIATTGIGSGNARAYSVAIQSDGKIVTAGYGTNGANNDFALARYTSTGALDTGFGTTTSGIVTTDINSSVDRANAVAIQSDGKIVAVGFAGNDFAVARYNANGSLDTGFGTTTSGIVTTAIGSGVSEARAVAIQSDGKIVAAGLSDNGSDDDFTVVRYNANGTLDTGFGTSASGIVTTPIGSGTDRANAVVIQSDGKIVAVGQSYDDSTNNFALVRYNIDGSLDTDFGSGGKVMTDFTSVWEQALAAAIQSDDGKIVVAGSSGNPGFTVARYLAGELVPSVSLSASPNPVTEGSSVTITATLSPSLSSAVTIPLTLTPGTAGSGEYGTLASIAIASGQTTGTGTITTTADTEVEDDETFTVSLDEDSLPAGVVTGPTTSVQITIDDDDVPAAPTGLDAVPLNATRLSLEWAAPAGTLTGYDVHYTSAPSSGSGAVTNDAAVQTVSAAAGWFAADPDLRPSSTSQYIYGITTDTDYRVRVRAVSSAGPGEWAFDGVRLEAEVPTNVCVRVSTPSNGKATISFDASFPSQYNSEITQVKGSADTWPARKAHSPDFPTGAAWHARSGDPCRVGALEVPTPGATYDVRFHLVDIWSQVIETSTDPITVTVWDVPGKPAGVSATTGAGSGRLDVSWNVATSTGFAGNDANVDGDFDDAVDDAPATITDYRVRWRVKDTDSTTGGDQPGAWSSGESAGADDTSHAVSGLTAGEEYEVQVRALNGVNPGSDWSDAAAGMAGTGPILSSNADLSALTASSATGATGTYTALALSPAFATTTTAYTATVGNTVSHVKLTPTVDDTGNATVAVGKQGATLTAVTDTQDSAAIELAVGANAITVRITAEDSTTKDYTVTVTRQGPAVSLSASPNPVTEGSAVTITATLAAALSSDVAIPLTLTAGTAETGDYGTLTSITVSAGQTTGTGEIATNHDSGEDDETFTVALDTANLPSEVLAGSPNSVLVTISDDEGIPSVSLSASPNPVDEGSSVTITATLSKTLTADVTVPLTLTAGTAESGDHGTLASITVSSGQTTGTGAIRTNQDRDTDDETFTVSLGTLPSEVRAGSASSVLVTITDDDKAEVSLEASPNPVDEGNAVTITARLSKALPEAVTIPIGLAAFTAEDGDYGTLESITVVAGRTSGTGTITTVRDEDEDDDGFTVTVVDPIPSSLLLGYPFYLDITIRDDGPLRLELASSALRPGEGGSARLTATLNHPAPVGGARVRFGADGRGDSPASPLGDFTLEPAGEGQHDSEWMVIAEGERRATATLRVVNDTEPEDDETLVVWVRGDWTAEAPELELTIPANDGGGSGPAAWIDAEPNPVSEGRDVTVRVRLTEALGAEATIPLTLSRGTAEAGDYGTLASVTIAAGATVGTGVIATARDADGEDETFTVRLGRMPTGARAGTASSVVVTIDDLDGPRAWLEVEPNPVAEGSAITVTAKLEEALSRSVTIPVTVERVTSESGDHGVLSSIVIASGRTEGSGRIATRRDTDGDDETFTVSLGASLPSGVRAGHPESVEVVIADEGAAGPAAGVSLSASPNPVPEGESVTVTATLTEALTRSVTIPVTVSAGTSESGDHGTLAGIRIASGATSGTGAISTRADSDTGDETFTVSLGSRLPSGILASSPSSVTVTIADSGGDAPGRVRSLRVSAGDGRLDLAWSAPSSGAVTAYETQYRERGASGWTTLYESDYSDTAAAIVGLVNGTRYDVRVRASNEHGEGAWVASSGAPASGGNNSNGLRGLSVRVSDSPDGAYRALSLRPSFSSSVTAYTATAPAGTTHARVRVSASSPTALILVDGHEVASGSESPAVHVSSGAPVWIAVIPADNGEAKEYSVTITIP